MVLRSLLPLFLCSCATMVAPGPDEVFVTSDPAGAEVILAGESAGRTPVTVVVPRHVRTVTMRMEGWVDGEFPIQHELNHWVWGNILLGGVIGMIVDVASDSATLATGEVHGVLYRAPGQEEG